MDYKMSTREFDAHDIDAVEKESCMKDTHETNVTTVDDPLSLNKIGETNVSEKKIQDSNNVIKDTQENNANVLFTLIRTKCSSVSLLCLVRINVNKTLLQMIGTHKIV